MEEEILHEILQEMKGLRSDLSETNRRLGSLEETTNKRFESLEETTNKRFESLEQTTNKRFGSLEVRIDETNKHLDGLHGSLVIMQQAYTDVKFVVTQIKDFLSDRVIWSNDPLKLIPAHLFMGQFIKVSNHNFKYFFT